MCVTVRNVCEFVKASNLVKNCGSIFGGPGTPLQCTCLSCGRFASRHRCRSGVRRRGRDSATQRPACSPNTSSTASCVDPTDGFSKSSTDSLEDYGRSRISSAKLRRLSRALIREQIFKIVDTDI